jgi:hypothetical protein
MTTDRATYRGTREYQVMYDKLVRAARNGGQVFHAEVTEILAESSAEGPTNEEITRLLREIAEDEHRAGRPLLTALVLTGKGIPGNVFFATARTLSELASADPAEEMKFWMAEKAKVYETWKPRAE